MDREQELLNHAEHLNITVHFTNTLPDGRRGEWHHDNRRINIRASMSTNQRICTLQHELIHAELDHKGTQPPETEQRVNELAALRLISPPEYASAERMYGANRLLLARELEVTPTIIDAYQRILDRSR